MNSVQAKQVFIIIMVILFSNLSQAQHYNYESSWQEVKALEKEGLPKSALKSVEAIALQAKKDNNHPQIIKTMLFKSKYALVLEEDAQLRIINNFKSEIAKNEFPTKNILESILANLYWQYFQQNRYKFYNRTRVSEGLEDTTSSISSASMPNTDFRTWDLETLFTEVHLHFQKSLNNGLLLQQEPLKYYNALLHAEKGSKNFRPTLFDFLAHNALGFYKTDETQITKPAYKFEVDSPKLLADAETFSVLNLTSKDTSSLQLYALKIYKALIRFHLKNESPYALADVNIERLKFVNEHATFDDKEALILASLKSESDRLKSQEVSGLYDFEIASIYYNQSKKYNPKTNETPRWKAKEALGICNTVISKFPESRAAEKCTVLKSNILQSTLQLKTEAFLPIQKNARILVDYKNLSLLNFKIYKLSEKQYETFNKTYRQDEQWAFIKKLNATASWNSTLRDDGDFQAHSTEVLLPKLNNGRYLVVSSKKESSAANFAFAHVQVTNLALVETQTPNHKIFQIIDRNNGKPYADAKVEVSYFKRNNRTKQIENFTSDQLGQIQLKKLGSGWYRNINLKVKKGNELAYFGDYYLNQRHKIQKTNINYNAFLFTDRSIYRPGQTVYFKGIAMKTDKRKSEVLANHVVEITLFNVNGETIRTMGLTTNDFGSVSGEFILPNNGLNGEYSIQLKSEDKNGHLYITEYISLEEYKRPKFETKFNPVTETYKINDSVTVKVNALAYAGSNITNAKVVYRVHRKVQYPRWYFWYRPYINSEPQEITHGETITDDSGNFEITFKALPDTSVDKSSLPIFKYEVTADVTDINGETRSATTIVNVGYHALTASLSVPESLEKTKKDNTISITTQNLNGEFVPAKGVIKIYKLISPERSLRMRPWPAPDYQEFSKAAFNTLFPYDAYTDEHLPSNWEKGALVLEKSFNTENSKTLELGRMKKWESGSYIITLETKDKFGQVVKDEEKTMVFSENDETLPDHQLFNISTDKSSYNIGDTANVTIASSAENIAVTITIEKDRTIIKKEIITLNNNKRVISVPVTQDDLGGFAVNYSFAAFNSFQSGNVAIAVPYPSTDLYIETLTFRDKLLPGTDETWQFKIKGPQGDKVSAELLASMYDASLDQFKSHNWIFNPIQKPTFYSFSNPTGQSSFGTQYFRVYQERFSHRFTPQGYDRLNWFGFRFGNYYPSRLREALSGRVSGIQIMEDNAELEEVVVVGYGSQKREGITGAVAAVSPEQLNAGGDLENVEKTLNSISKEEAIELLDSSRESEKKPNFDNIKIRKNLQETAFFFPQLQTDAEGNISFSFNTPEALTQWKLQLLAHTKTLESATTSLMAVTQKELMVIPNAPRFLREGDKITISTKIANLTDKVLSGQAKLALTDAISGIDITNRLVTEALEVTNNSHTKDEASSASASKSFSINPKNNTQVSWNLTVPDNVQAVQYKILATSGDFSDGEQNALPVLSNRMLVTETLPMWVKSNETRSFTLDKLASSASATTLKHHKLTLEMTSNPAWYAVQALPYLMEYPYDCNEQTFSRYYANALASHIVNSNPRIQEVFNQWRNTEALLSNLEKNEELKSILIEETPWLRNAQSETEQKKRIALLFDLNKMNNELQLAINKLKSNQMNSGGWSWFKGGNENRYITQHIIAGFGHLKKLGVIQSPSTSLRTGAAEESMIKNAINYLDNEFVKTYKDIRKYDAKVDLNKDHLSYTQLHYLYMRSFFHEIKASKEVEDIMAYYQSQIQKYWVKRSLYAKGMMALVSYRTNDIKTASKILKSLKETSITSDELGMYWKSSTNSWYWYQAPIETQALLIEAFGESGSVIQNETKNLETIDNLKIWLLKNKQTNKWKTTKATTEAVYALLLQGSDWLSVTDMVDVVLGGRKIEPSKLEDVKVEAGTGYYKTSWASSEIKPEMAEVEISKKGQGITWGALYWQYFEDLDKITSAETPLSLNKKLFLKTNTDTGEEITEISSETKLKVGDLVRVRIELKSDRNMEFLHMKDMRASGLEPVNVISKYKWQDGLGYYESTKDASTNFFFDYLPKGVYVFEYDLRVNNAGNMSNGITTIQSMYAPEFSSHSEGVRIMIEQPK
ncbi:Alpha-2-macroglobulin family N-terminal region [Hyunsoonleella jejuensis]|uniref:Alpha-2-macroglobulin family N-terminal region n=1 Tax=Hyunsoonleella jejuensis TaxID=419940 RepID=A0A1H9IA84_9FLAO|nr:MG2 domain-containing protein [Hyunsoonleella jejuensis]SEQ71466.1 Alpha-2-macroglobulin family N-terminal region [Hyunsoonleella jejuensis]